MLNILRRLLLQLSAILVICVPTVHAQEFPSKPIRIIVGNAPGVTPDTLTRLIAPGMSQFIGQTVLVENKGGANGSIAYEYVAKQVAADGYTVALGSTSQLAILPWIYKSMRFDPLKDLVPVIGLATSRYVMASSAKLPFKVFNDLVEYAKANPDKLNYGSSGATTRFVTEAVIRSVGIKITYIPYRAGAAYQAGLVANEVQVGVLSEASAIGQGNRVQPLAVTGDPRSTRLPNVPTFAELGLKNPQIPGTSYELYVPVGTPKTVVAALHAAALKAVEQSDVKERLARIGLTVIGESPDAAMTRLAEDGKQFASLAQAIGIKPE